jgi:hypothetical protein
MHTEMAIFARDYPEMRLMVGLVPPASLDPEHDSAVQQLAKSMWGANCHYGLIMTPTKTFILRDDFSSSGPESIRVTEVLPTDRVLSRMGWPAGETLSPREFEALVQRWLRRLAASYEDALPEDPAVQRAFFPDIIGAVADGRIVTGAPT